MASVTRVNHLARLHYELYTVVGQINKLYSFQVGWSEISRIFTIIFLKCIIFYIILQLMTYIIGNFVFTIIILFGIYRYMWTSKQNQFLEHFASAQFFWATYYNVVYYFIFWTGNHIKTEVSGCKIARSSCKTYTLLFLLHFKGKDTQKIIVKALIKSKDICVREQVIKM